MINHDWYSYIVAFSPSQSRRAAYNLQLLLHRTRFLYDIRPLKGINACNLILVGGWENNPVYTQEFKDHINFIVKTAPECNICVERCSI